MVLLVNHRFLPISPSSVSELYSQFPHLLREAETLAARKPSRLEPRGVMYVRQKQWGVTHTGDNFEDGQEVIGCGTEDILTCHVIVLRDPTLGVTAIGHFDEFSRAKDFRSLMETFLERVRQRRRDREDWEAWEDGDWEWEEGSEEEEEELDPTAMYELQIVGGYADSAGKARKLSQRFFKHLHDLPIRLEMKLCCLGKPNTRKVGSDLHPVISGVYVSLDTGLMVPAEFHRTFTDFQPDIRNVLLIFPPLVMPGQKKKSSLKEMILKQEDRGFAKSRYIYEYNNVYLP